MSLETRIGRLEKISGPGRQVILWADGSPSLREVDRLEASGVTQGYGNYRRRMGKRPGEYERVKQIFGRCPAAGQALEAGARLSRTP